jgi:Na+-transporting methylmalonyl-CoA/oxaloacetate decarboxylase gamma subunit
VSWWNQVSGTVSRGLQITLVGMSLVFFTLGLIIVCLILLTRLPGLRSRRNTGKTAELAAAELQPLTPVVQAAHEEDELAQVAAIAVAVLRGRRTARIHVATRAAGSTWRQYGRAHQVGL